MARTRWWWVRHGPTHEKNFVGWRDVRADLSDRAALERLSVYLPEEALVISSDLSRSRDTADAIAGARRRWPDDARLREINLGDWDGLHFSQVAESHPELSRAFWENPGDICAPGGESWNDLRARVDACVDTLAREHTGTEIIAVAHFGVILTQLQRARGQTATAALAQKIDPLSVTCLAHDVEWSVGVVNHCP